MTQAKTLLLVVLLLLLSAMLQAQTAPCGSTATPPTGYQHVVVFSFENRVWGSGTSGVGGVGFGATLMPYMHGIAAPCTYFTDWTETNTSQNSLTQYIGATSGVNNTATVNDCNPSTTCRSNDDNIFRQLRVIGKTAVNYVEGATTGCSAAGNAAKHIPDLYYFGTYTDGTGTHSDHDFCSTEVRPYSEFDVNNLPTYAFITPTLCNDGHDCPNSTVDNWAATNVAAVLNSPSYLSGNTAVFIWYDEDHPVPNAIIAPTAHLGNITTTGIGSHASELKTIELLLGLPVMNQGQLTTATDLRAITGLATVGGGGSPAVSLNPTSLTFAAQKVGTTSSAQVITLTNSGTALLNISGITKTGTNAGDYALPTSASPCGATLAAGANCKINVSFTPSATGTRTAAVSIADDASGSPQRVALTGTGTQTPPVASFTLTPTSGVAPLTVTANSSASSDPDGTIASRSIDFGDGSALVTTTTATHTYTGSGTFTVTLSVTDDSGLSATTAKSAAASLAAGFFGMHETNLVLHGWPTVGVGAFRIWDNFPNVSWVDIHTATGTYDWTKLDNLVNQITPHAGVDIVYTFGRTPVWASSNPTGSCGNSVAGTCYKPANEQDWKDFVGAVSSRYQGRIKYFELWNEPNAANFWSGTTAELVTMAQDAYPIIKANGGTVLSVAPQGTSANAYMNTYLGAGGGAYADTIDFHGYVGATPETIATLIANMKSVMTTNGVAAKELWDTEHSWGADPTFPDLDLQAAWVGRHVILSAAKGVTRSFWYSWDNDVYGTLWNKTSLTITKAGTAYGEVYNWLQGATFANSCVQASTVWTCDITRPSYQARVVWDTSKTCSAGACTTSSYSVPAQYTKYRDLAGSSFNISGGTVQIGAKPILLEPGTVGLPNAPTNLTAVPF